MGAKSAQLRTVHSHSQGRLSSEKFVGIATFMMIVEN